MIFELTDSLRQQIFQALENQDEVFVLEAESGTLVSVESEDVVDDENFYSLPEWSSDDGFELMQTFVNNLHYTSAKNQLQAILHSGRGVFKGFKNKIKEFQQVEKLWHSFKFRKMNAYIQSWYNELCEVWGLEKLQEEPEFMDDLLGDDFSFRDFDFSIDREIVLASVNASSLGKDENLPQTVDWAAHQIWQHQFLFDGDKQKGFVCHTLSDEFAGVISFVPFCKGKGMEKAAVLTAFFVPEKFRGLGIGSRLLEMCLDSLKAFDFKWVLLTYMVTADSEKLFTGFNFKRTAVGLMVEL